MVFLFPQACSSGDRFLPTTKVVELLFPPARSCGGCDFPTFKAMEFVFLLLFPLVLADQKAGDGFEE